MNGSAGPRTAQRLQPIAHATAIVKSPIDGIVLDDFSLTPGTLLSTATPVVRIANLERMARDIAAALGGGP